MGRSGRRLVPAWDGGARVRYGGSAIVASSLSAGAWVHLFEVVGAVGGARIGRWAPRSRRRSGMASANSPS